MQDMSFANVFAPSDEARWRELATIALKGRSLEKLQSRSYDDLTIRPLYASGESWPRIVHAPPKNAPNDWTVLARLDHPDAAQANAQALIDLENGADGLHIVMAGAIGAYGFGLSSSDVLTRVLEGVRLDFGIGVELDAPAAETAHALAKHVRDQKIDPASTNISFGLNPIGALMGAGARADVAARNFQTDARALKAAGFAGPFALADARPIHAAGGTEAQELAYALSAAIQMMRILEADGVAPDESARNIAFRLALDADEFLGIAKIRALRKLWTRVQEACGIEAAPARIHAETAWRMMTRRDPYVNMLRETVAVFSGAVGGADAISVLPFTQALGLPDAFARRAARNTQLILKEEAHLDKVADPAAGAGGFEALTLALCEKAWSLFQAQQAMGGFPEAFGPLGESILASRAQRLKNIASRKDALTGVSEFPDIAERPAAVLAPAPIAEPGDGAFAPMRLAAGFEALRDRSDALARGAADARPKIFLANLGPIAAFNARATFAKNFFEAGGILAVGEQGFTTPEAAAAAFKASGAAIACLCSSDALYAEFAAQTARALKAEGAKAVFLAGQPGALEADLRQAGVTAFIFVGADVLQSLEQAWAWILPSHADDILN